MSTSMRLAHTPVFKLPGERFYGFRPVGSTPCITVPIGDKFGVDEWPKESEHRISLTPNDAGVQLWNLISESKRPTGVYPLRDFYEIFSGYGEYHSCEKLRQKLYKITLIQPK